jgi:hypothetical protein
LENPADLNQAKIEFGSDITDVCNGWASLSKPLDFAIAAGPLVLFQTRKLSAATTSKCKIATVSYYNNFYPIISYRI